MKLVSWNVNGLRACLQKGFSDFFSEIDADVFCLQETKMQPEQARVETPGYHQYWFSAERKGYSGTALFTKEEPLSVVYGVGVPEYDAEGRVLTAEFDRFFVVTVYSPNAQSELTRLPLRMAFEQRLREYLTSLQEKKPVILCGDLNVAHEEIDLKNPGPNRGSAGFTQEERDQFSRLLEIGLVDTFRWQHPDRTGANTGWSSRSGARSRNAGWRIDYFLVSEQLKDRIDQTLIFSEILGSDHCPVGLWLKPSKNSDGAF